MGLKKVFKKVMYTCMAVAMAAVPTVPAFAAQSDVIDSTRTGSLTIHKYDMTAAEKNGVDLNQFTSTGKQDQKAEDALKKYAIKGVEFSYLRVGDVEQQSENGKVQMIYELPDELQKIIGLSSDDAAKTEGSKVYFTSQVINQKLAEALEDNTVTKDKLEAYMGKSGTAMDLTDAKGVTKKDKLPLGLYLIVETKVPEDVTYTTNPWFVQLPSTDGEFGLFPKISEDGTFARIEQHKNGDMEFIEWNVTTLNNPPKRNQPKEEKLKVSLSDGMLVAQKSPDPEYPGMEIEYYSNDESSGFPTARILAEQKPNGEKNFYIWGDHNEDPILKVKF